MNAIPFDAIRAAALAQSQRLLRDWFPRGRLSGHEFTVGNLQGEPGESLSINVRTGRWGDFAAGFSGFDLIDLRAAMRHNGDRVAAARELGAALGITLNGHAGQTMNGAEQPHRKIVAAYPYHDQSGALLFEVVRFAPKDFRQRRPDGNGGHAWNLDGIEKVLFRLPEVIGAVEAGRTIYVVEGEKAVLGLVSIGLDATCSPGGANKWRPEYGAPLAGADTVIVPDNDAPGEAHALDVARKLQGIARSIRIARLTGPPKSDPWDWIYNGGTAEQLEQLARETPEEIAPQSDGSAHSSADEPPPHDGGPAPHLRIINPVELEFAPIPEREWIVPDWLPVGNVTADYGDGGTGKTLLAQQLMTSCATGTSWCGISTMRCRTFALFCEDDEAELHRRQAKICDALGVSFSALGNMRWVSGVGQDNALATFTSDGRMHTTERFGAIAAAASEFGARLVVLDTAADLFAGNENDRHQVRQFIGLLNRLAAQIRGAVLLNAHPSRTGLSTGNLDGGSTAWSNSVRSRWSLARPEVDEGQPEAAERVLTRRKANYSSIGGAIQLRWVKGVLAPIAGIGGAIHRAAAEAVFMDLLELCRGQGLDLSHSKNAGNYAPKVFAQRADRHGYNRKEFEGAMLRLIEQRKLAIQEYDRFGHKRLVAS